ncbi:MAG: hypothetical protein Q8P67_21865 [archaeon]|nr:hypothetical protein [archaeon]
MRLGAKAELLDGMKRDAAAWLKCGASNPELVDQIAGILTNGPPAETGSSSSKSNSKKSSSSKKKK